MKDFFTAYKSANTRKYISSIFVALTLSIAFVSVLNQVGPRNMLLANVMQAGSPEIVSYTADLRVERHGDMIDLKLWKEAFDVDMITLSFLGDPEKFHSLASPDKYVTISTTESWVFLIKKTLEKAHILPGSTVISLTATLSGESVLVPVDAILVSAGQSYSLSIQGE